MRDPKERTREYFDGRAADYDNSHDGKYAAHVYDAARQAVESARPRKLLDVGCGNGNLLAALRGKGVELYGIDLSEGMIAEAQAKLGEDAVVTVGDAERLPYGDACFDTLLCIASFHHYPDPRAVLAEMNRVLKPGGSLILGDSCPRWPVRWSLNLFIRFSGGGDYRIYSRKALCGLLEGAGFSVERFERPRAKYGIVVARKRTKTL